MNYTEFEITRKTPLFKRLWMLIIIMFISSLSLAITAFAIYIFFKNILMIGFIDAIAMSIVIILIFIILLVVIILSNITDTIIEFIKNSLKGIKIDKSWKK